jgi:acyl-CoA synthetase (NDP forming)
MSESARQGLGAFLQPRSVAVVGASANPRGYSGQTMRVILEHTKPDGYYLVNPRRDEIDGRNCYPTVSAIGEPVDLAVITIPAAEVPACLKDCAAAGTKAAYIISAGFGEAGTAEGRRLNDEIVAIAAVSQMRIAGPNGQGIYDLHADFAFGFSPAMSYHGGLRRRPRAGNIAIVSQSGGVGNGLFSAGLARGMAFSRVISTGNELDVDALDFVEHSLACGDTDVVFMYIEGFCDPKRVRGIAIDALTRDKALIVMKAGRTDATRQAMQSHTGHIAGPTDLYSALFAHHGIVEVRDYTEALDVLGALSRHRGSSGNRIGIVSGSGGSGLWLAETCGDYDVEVPRFTENEQKRAREYLPEEASTGNPVDSTAAGARDAGRLTGLLREVLTFDSVDVLLYVLGMATTAPAQEATDKPIMLFCHYYPTQEGIDQLADAGLTWFSSQAGAARAVEALALWAAAKARSLEDVGRTDTELKVTVEDCRSEQSLKDWLRLRGVAVPHGVVVSTAEEAAEAFERYGPRVVMKAQIDGLHHKSDVGGVRLGIESAEQAAQTFTELAAIASETAIGVLVEEMAAPGRELLVGSIVDPDLGPFVILGTGGTDADLGLDKVIRLAPLTHEDARAMVRSLRLYPALQAWRGAPPRDVDALVDLLVRVSRIVAASSEVIRELEINPVILHARGEGLRVVDALAIPTAVDTQREG